MGGFFVGQPRGAAVAWPPNRSDDHEVRRRDGIVVGQDRHQHLRAHPVAVGIEVEPALALVVDEAIVGIASRRPDEEPIAASAPAVRPPPNALALISSLSSPLAKSKIVSTLALALG